MCREGPEPLARHNPWTHAAPTVVGLLFGDLPALPPHRYELSGGSSPTPWRTGKPVTTSWDHQGTRNDHIVGKQWGEINVPTASAGGKPLAGRNYEETRKTALLATHLPTSSPCQGTRNRFNIPCHWASPVTAGAREVDPFGSSATGVDRAGWSKCPSHRHHQPAHPLRGRAHRHLLL